MGKLLTDSIRETLQAQYPNEDIIEIDNCIYHVPNAEEAWKLLRDKVRPDWEVTKEIEGLEHYIIYNPKHYKISLKDRLVCTHLTENIELPINCSSCHGIFSWVRFPKGFEFSETFDTSEVVDMGNMFDISVFKGDISLGVGFKTDKVKDFSNMFRNSSIAGTLDLGPNFSLENADTVRGMFEYSEIKKPIKFGVKFNPKNALYLEYMFSEMNMPKGFNLGDNFHIRDGARVWDMFAETKFSNDFWLPDCFNVDGTIKNCYNIFKNAKLPKRVSGINSENIKEIINSLKVRDDKVAIKYLESI